MADLNTVLELSRTYSGMQNIPESVLIQHKLTRITDERTGSQKVMPVSSMDNQSSRSSALLSLYAGWVFGPDYELLLNAQDGTIVLADEQLARIGRRAKAFKNAGIPPIYHPDYFGVGNIDQIDFVDAKVSFSHTTVFPIVDYILQFSTDVLNKRRASLVMRVKEAMGSKSKKIKIYPITASWASDVRAFCRVAFDQSGSLLRAIVREVHHNSSEKFRFRSEENEQKARDHTDRAFLFLEELLRPMALECSREYIQWDGDISVVGKRLWFTVYDPTEHDRIASAYFSSLGSLPTGDERAVFSRMAATFPHLAPSVDTLRWLGIQTSIEQGLETSDLRYLPNEVFAQDYPDQRIRTAAMIQFEGYCAKWVSERDFIVLQTLSSVASMVKIPHDVLRELSFRNLYNQARLKVLQAMTYDEICSRFHDSNGRFAASGFGLSIKNQGDPGFGKIVHDYLSWRMSQLKQ
jgi:hypothetical protein